MLLHKSFNPRFVDTTKEVNITHCGVQLIICSTSYFHLKSIGYPTAIPKRGSKSSKHETALYYYTILRVTRVEALDNQIGSPKQLSWLPWHLPWLPKHLLWGPWQLLWLP